MNCTTDLIADQLQHAKLQLERLRRHYEHAVRTYDEISLLDLAHSLRLCAELKHPLREIAPSFFDTGFETGRPVSRVLHAARGHQYVFAYMPGGVVTRACRGDVASFPEMHGDFTSGISVRPSPGQIELDHYCVVGAALDAKLIKALKCASIKRCNYLDWLGAETVRLCYPGEDQAFVHASLCREVLIKRVANTHGGSHPAAVDPEDNGNEFDLAVRYLMKYKMGGLPLPYFVLLKIAQDILAVAPKHGL